MSEPAARPDGAVSAASPDGPATAARPDAPERAAAAQDGGGPHRQIGTSGPRRRATEAERKALASAVRLRILRLCLFQERTNRQLADALGRDPATVLHHVRTLVDSGFLRAGEARRGPRGSREIPYRATGLSWELDLSGDLPGADAGPNHLAAILEAAAAEVALAAPDEVRLTRLALKLSPQRAAELERRLFGVIDEFVSQPPDADGGEWALLVALHPEPN